VTDPREVVRRGYDANADRYGEWAAWFETAELQWVDDLLERLPEGSRVLDVGCGGGRRPAQSIAARHRYTGVDISDAQITRARERIPAAELFRADATRIAFAPRSFDAVVSLFMFGHIPGSEQAPLVAEDPRLAPAGGC
jgi:SAM-dependent methyltransferase